MPADHRLAWLVLAISLCITVFSWALSVSSLNARSLDRYKFEVDKAVYAISERMKSYEQVLRGGVGLFEASDEVTREDWHNYVESLQIDTYWPGIQGVGHAIMLSPAKLDKHVAKVRQSGFPNYSVHPEGSREQYSSIIYLEPFSGRNLRAFGYDMFSEQNRRLAMELARDTGAAAVSGAVTLVQETSGEIQHGFLMYLPLYKKSLPRATVEQRRAALSGFVFSPFRVKDMMQRIFGPGSAFVDFALYDGNDPKDEKIFYSDISQTRTHLPQFASSALIKVPGRVWNAKFTSSPELEHELSNDAPLFISIGGVVFSLILFFIFRQMSKGHAQAARSAIELQAMLERQQLAASVFRNAREGVLITNSDTVIIDVNNMFTLITGYSAEEAKGQRPSLLSSGQHDEAFWVEMFRQVHANGHWTGEIVNRCKDGSQIINSVNISVIRDTDNMVRNYLALFSDITEQKRLQKDYERQALHDSLTGLANRQQFLGRMEVMITQSMRHQRPFGVVFLDLDGFKPINDVLGHEEGDRALIEVARRLKQSLRAGDLAARLGGDEFGLLLNLEAGEEPTVVLERVRQSLAEPYALGGNEMRMSASLGYSMYPADGSRVAELIRRADTAMYRAKQTGGNKVVQFD